MIRFLFSASVSIFLLLAASCGKNARQEPPSGEEAHGHSHGGHDGGEELELSSRQMETVGIVLGRMEKRAMSDLIRVSGSLAVPPTAEGIAVAPLPGRIVELKVTPGDKVKAGAVIAYVSTPEILSLRQDLLQASLDEEQARLELDRQELLAAHGAGIAKNLEAARASLASAGLRKELAQRRLSAYGVSPGGDSDRYPVKSGVGGVVTEVPALPGEYADIQTPLARIVDCSAVFASIQVPESALENVAPGRKVSMRLVNLPEIEFSGTVEEIIPAVDAATRTVSMKVSLAEMPADGRMIPGMALTGEITAGEEEKMTLPEDAVIISGGRRYVFALEDRHEEEGEEKYHFEKVEVVCGPTVQGYTQITPVDELPADALIVTKGAFYLNSMASDHGEHAH